MRYRTFIDDCFPNRKHIRAMVIIGSLIAILFLIVSPYFSRLAGFFQRRGPVCKNCNVIVISLDTVSANHLPCYGYARNTAPNLCRYAGRSVLFKNAYSNASWTLPADVSMFTSWYPQYHRILNLEDEMKTLPATAPLLPEILRQNGYTTYFGVPEHDQAFPVDGVYKQGVTGVIPVGYGPDEDLGAALTAFLKSVTNGHKTFLYLHSYEAHGPYIPNNPTPMFTNDRFPNIPLTWDGIYDNFSPGFYRYLVDQLSQTVGKPNATVDTAFLEKLENAPTLSAAKQLAQSKENELDSYYTEYNYFSKIDLRDPRQVEYVKALYDQKIFELDAWIGRVLIPFLESPAIQKNTIVVITSEHGEEFMEHGRLGHITLYDSNTKVPFIVSIPGYDKHVVEGPVQGIDIAPTIIDALGLPVRRYLFQGISLLDSAVGNRLRDRLLIANGYNTDHEVKTVRNDGWKMFMKWLNGGFVPYELYNVAQDPMETNNVLADHLDTAKRLMKENSRLDAEWQSFANAVRR